MAILEKLKQKIGQFFQPVQKVRVRDVLREIPETIKKGIKKGREITAMLRPELSLKEKEKLEKRGSILTKGGLVAVRREGKEPLFIDLMGIGGLKVVGKTAKILSKSSALTKHFKFFKEISAPEKFRPPVKLPREEVINIKKDIAKKLGIELKLNKKGLLVAPKGSGPQISKLLKEQKSETLIKQAQEAGIALRKTKGEAIVPAVRKSGTFVPEDFTNYKNFKDVKPGVSGGTKDITRLIQEMDGSLNIKQLSKLPSQTGALSKYVLWRTRDITRQAIEFSQESIRKIIDISGDIKKGSKDAKLANKVIEKISSKDKNKNTSELLKRFEISKITKNPNIVDLAKKARIYFDDLLDMQNVIREERGQKLIPKREFYSPQEIKNASLWEKALGLREEPANLIKRPGLPDYIFPDKPFNPRELARQTGLREFEREMDLVELLDRYSQTATKDIFSTSIIQNNKAFIQQLETMGYPNSARTLQNWTAEAFGGVRAQVDRGLYLSPSIEKGMNWWRGRLVKNVFPLNFAWNGIVQTSSVNLTGTRYGWLNTAKSSQEWFTNKNIRKEVLDNAYSAIIKSQKIGKISRQDINQGIIKASKIQEGPLEKATDAANFFTEWVERHLTGISIRAAYNDGIKKGLKGKALWEYASDGGAKTQSMYNMEDLPGILRSNFIKTGAPFQTFSFEMFNTLREFAGKTGVPPATAGERIKWVLRFMAGAWATNQIGQAATGRQPWEASSFIPFYGNFITPIFSERSSETARALPSFIGVGREVWIAVKNVVEKGNWDKLRKTTIRYGLPFGGIQASKTIDGLIAVSKQGKEDSSGKLLFPIVKPKEQMRAILLGPWGTEEGKEYIEEKFK